MGGSGSGRYSGFGSKGTCEASRRIELSYLKQHDCLRPGYSGTLNWNRGGEPTGKIGFRTHSDGLELDYSTKSYGEEEWTPVKQYIWFDWTSQHLGGKRRWLLCPHCNRRCSVLYHGERFLCRTCQNLTYQSQTQTPLFRLLEQAQKIRDKLDGSICTFDAFPPKPKGMHWRTYERIRAKGERLERHLDQVQREWLGML